MRVVHRLSSGFVTFLFCLFFQHCTQTIPTPTSAPVSRSSAAALAAIANPALKKLAQEKLASSAFAGSEASLELIKVPIADSVNQHTVAAKLQQQTVCSNYYYIYYTNGVETGRDFAFRDCTTTTWEDGSGGGGGPGGGGGGGSSGDSPSALSPNTVLVLPPDIPVSDIKQYLKCFTTNDPATLTVYARQPVPGSTDPYTFHGLKPDVGHTFISITQNGITRVFGFYPTSKVSFIVNAPGMWGDNSSTSYTASVSTQIFGGNLYSLLQYIYSVDGKTYDLGTYNCTDFAIRAAHAAGIDLPDTWGRWGGFGGGSNPGNFGNDLNSMSLPQGTTRGGEGSSPTNKGSC